MDTKKLLMGTIVGGITYFFLGWIIYGMLLMGMMAEYSNPACMRAEADMIWWAMILGNLGFGALLTYIFIRSGNVNSFGSGAQTGAVVALLAAISMDLMMFATSTLMTNPMGIVIDVIASTIIGAIAGGAIGAVIRRGQQPAA
jgi:hypothetical protein